MNFCNGKRTPQEVIEAFGKKYGIEHKPIVEKFIFEAINSSVFDSEGLTTLCKISNYRLRILQLSLTSACNLKCIYCYATDREEKGKHKLIFNDYRKIIDDAVKLSSGLDIVLTGGEPLLNKNCFAIAEYAKSKGCNPQLLSNGTLINEENIVHIKNIFSLVKISVDGSTKEMHEKLRGENSYSSVMKALNLLDSAKASYSISMTINKLNINDINNMAAKYGAILTFAPLFKAGSAKNSKLAISGEEYYRALSNAKGINPLNYCESSLENAKQKKIIKCAIGDAEISISETGDVYPCQLLHEDKFLAGNILNNSLFEIYNNSESLHKCRLLTVDNIKGCSSCFLRYVCGGACRARAFFESGKIGVSGKFCEYEKKAFINGIFLLYEKNAL